MSVSVKIILTVIYLFAIVLLGIRFARSFKRYIKFCRGEKKKVKGFLIDPQSNVSTCEYGYKVDGILYKGSFSAAERDRGNISEVEVEYLVKNPENHAVIGKGKLSEIVFSIIMLSGLLFFIVTGFIFWFIL